MPPRPDAATELNLVVDRATHSIILTRQLAGSREQVFDAWTQPDQVAVWWDPSGAPLAECQIDLRPGGGFKFVNQAPSGGPPFAGVYREISPPVRLVFDALGSVGTVLLEDVGGRTHLTVTIACASAEHLEQFVQMGVADGTAQTLDNLVAFIVAR
jgi:uncharacterized protein YndB with AHSA1/START domain